MNSSNKFNIKGIKVASIDIGSNSLNLLLAYKSGDLTNAQLEEVESTSFVTHLGKGVAETKVLSAPSMEATLDALKVCVQKILDFGVNLDQVIAVATEASRVANNSNTFFKKISNELGLKIQIITGAAEAELSALGAASSAEDEQFCLLDIGGASTEFVKANKSPFKFIGGFSSPIGSVRATEWLSKGILQTEMDSILNRFESQLSEFKEEKLVCVAGTMTTIFSMIFSPLNFSASSIEGKVLKREDFKKLKDEIEVFSNDEMGKRYPVLGKRKETIKAGLQIAIKIFDYLDTPEVICSTRGLRFGVLLQPLRGKDLFVFSN